MIAAAGTAAAVTAAGAAPAVVPAAADQDDDDDEPEAGTVVAVVEIHNCHLALRQSMRHASERGPGHGKIILTQETLENQPVFGRMRRCGRFGGSYMPEYRNGDTASWDTEQVRRSEAEKQRPRQVTRKKRRKRSWAK